GQAVLAAGREVGGEGGEKADFDGHLNPPCPSCSTEGRMATRRRSPGWIGACRPRLFQRSTSPTETPYCFAMDDTVSRGRTTWTSATATARVTLRCPAATSVTGVRCRGANAATTRSEEPTGTRSCHGCPGGVMPRTSTRFSDLSVSNG